MHTNDIKKIGPSENLPPEYKDFCCPICKSDKYICVTKYDGEMGRPGRSRFTHCVCSECSVHFQNPEKFSKKSEKSETIIEVDAVDMERYPVPLAISLINDRLRKGESVSIPSLGIVLQPKRKKEPEE